MKKNAVILSVQPLETASRYGEYLRILEQIPKKIGGVEKLGENVWLIHLPYGVPSLSQIVSVCEYASFEYRLLHIDHEAVWVSYPNKND